MSLGLVWWPYPGAKTTLFGLRSQWMYPISWNYCKAFNYKNHHCKNLLGLKWFAQYVFLRIWHLFSNLGGKGLISAWKCMICLWFLLVMPIVLVCLFIRRVFTYILILSHLLGLVYFLPWHSAVKLVTCIKMALYLQLSRPLSLRCLFDCNCICIRKHLPRMPCLF